MMGGSGWVLIFQMETWFAKIVFQRISMQSSTVPGDKGEDVLVIEMIPKPDTPVVWGKIVSKMPPIMFQWKFPIVTKMER